jgi:5-methylcytosine-specific restriction endonuclease McrA
MNTTTLIEITLSITLLIIGFIGIYRIKYKFAKRNHFSLENRNSARYKIQHNKCHKCKKSLSGAIQYHHKNGHRSNNKLTNCQALHRKCHLQITKKNKLLYDRMVNWSAIKWIIVSTAVLFLLFIMSNGR